MVYILERIVTILEQMVIILELPVEERARMSMMIEQKRKSIDEVLEEVQVVINAHFFDEFSKTKSSLFPKRVLETQNAIEMLLLKKTWRSIHCTPKTMKVIREIQENLLCVGRRKEMITKKKAETMCMCSKTRQPLNAKHIISCCRKVAGEINARHDIVVNILLNNILKQRVLITHEQKWDDRKMVRTTQDEITIGTEHWRSEEMRDQ